MRLFISIPLPKKARKELIQVKKNFADFPAKWVEEENLHLTLIFLGETRDTEAKEVAEAIDVATKDLNLINLETGGLLLLPDEKRPRILAIKLTGETEKLSKLAGNIKKELRKRKISFDEKPFRPHATLARLKKLRSGERKELRDKVRSYFQAERENGGCEADSYNLPTIEFKARRVELTESKLTPTGPIYFAVAKSERMK